MTDLDKDDTLLTVNEVAKMLGVDHTTVRRWMKIGALEFVELPYIGKRRLRRVRKSVVEEYLKPKLLL